MVKICLKTEFGTKFIHPTHYKNSFKISNNLDFRDSGKNMDTCAWRHNFKQFFKNGVLYGWLALMVEIAVVQDVSNPCCCTSLQEVPASSGLDNQTELHLCFFPQSITQTM